MCLCRVNVEQVGKYITRSEQQASALENSLNGKVTNLPLCFLNVAYLEASLSYRFMLVKFNKEKIK